MARTFAEIMKELEPHLQIDTTPDSNDACRFRIDGTLPVQIELNHSTGFLMICSEIGELPPGRYREDVFRSALRENGKPFPRFGDFGYSKKNHNLVLYDSLPLDTVDGESLFNHLLVLSQKARTWQDSIQRGEVPGDKVETKLPGPEGLFGLRP